MADTDRTRQTVARTRVGIDNAASTDPPGE